MMNDATLSLEMIDETEMVECLHCDQTVDYHEIDGGGLCPVCVAAQEAMNDTENEEADAASEVERLREELAEAIADLKAKKAAAKKAARDFERRAR
jgi:F0F1-type ATP synthase epsilon subunit